MKKIISFFLFALLTACNISHFPTSPQRTSKVTSLRTPSPFSTELLYSITPESTTRPTITTVASKIPSPSLPATQPAIVQRNPSLPSFYYFHWFDRENGWAETIDGHILRMMDGGENWVDVTPIGAVAAADATTFFLDPMTAWFMARAGVSTGTLFHTSDGGLTWDAYSTPFGYISAYVFPSLAFLNAREGWFAGSPDCSQSHSTNCPFPLYQTMDGGQTWSTPQVITFPQELLDSASSFRIDISILNSMTIWAIVAQVIHDQPLTLYVTRDASRTWQAVKVPSQISSSMVSHSDVLPAAHLAASTENQPAYPPVFLSDQEGFFSTVTSEGNQTVLSVYLTEDGGATWSPAPTALKLASGVFIQAPKFTSRLDWNTKCDNVQPGLSSFCVTHDGGNTWQVVRPNFSFRTDGLPALASFQFLNGQTGWAAVDEPVSNGKFFYTLYHTDDGGKTWAPLNPALTALNPVPTLTPIPTALISGLSVQSPTPEPTVLLPPTSFPPLRMMHWIDTKHGWALTDYSNDPARSFRLLSSADGGASWRDVTPPVTDTMSLDYFFLDAKTVWGVLGHQDPNAGKGTLYRTINGGQKWNSIPMPFSQGYVHFFDEMHGWAIASLNIGAGNAWMELYRTSDGGQTWTQLMPPTALGGGEANLPYGYFHISSSQGFSFQDPSTIWLGGGYLYTTNTLTLIYSRNSGNTWQSQELALPDDLQDMEASVPIFLNSNDGFFSVKYEQSSAPGIETQPGFLIFATKDGGASWIVRSRVEGVESYQVVFVTQTDWYAYLTDQLLATHDSGQTWQSQAYPATKYGDCRPSFVDGQHGWASVGQSASGTENHNSLFRTDDGGKTCEAVNPVLK